MDFTLINFILRILAALALVPAIYEVWRISQLIDNKQFSAVLMKIVAGFLAFALIRIMGANIDGFFDLGIPVSGYIVNFGFWFWAAYYLHKQRDVLDNDDAETLARRHRVSRAIGEIITDMKSDMKEAGRTNGYNIP